MISCNIREFFSWFPYQACEPRQKLRQNPLIPQIGFFNWARILIRCDYFLYSSRSSFRCLSIFYANRKHIFFLLDHEPSSEKKIACIVPKVFINSNLEYVPQHVGGCGKKQLSQRIYGLKLVNNVKIQIINSRENHTI